MVTKGKCPSNFIEILILSDKSWPWKSISGGKTEIACSWVSECLILLSLDVWRALQRKEGTGRGQEMFTGGWLLFTVVNIQAEWFGDTLHGWLVLLCYSLASVPTLSPTLEFCQNNYKETLYKVNKAWNVFLAWQNTLGPGNTGVLKCWALKFRRSGTPGPMQALLRNRKGM